MGRNHRQPTVSHRTNTILNGSFLIIGVMGFALAFTRVFRARGLRGW